MKRTRNVLIILTVLGCMLINGLALAGSAAEEEANLWKSYKQALKKGDAESFRIVIRDVGKVMSDYPSKVNIADMLFLLGLCYENVFRFPKALVYYKELRDVHPYHKNSKAVKYKLDLIENTYKTEKNALVLFVTQERLMMSGQYKEALEKCAKLINDYPTSSLADNVQNIIGYIYLTYLKEYGKAVLEYKKLLSVYPNSAFQNNAIFAIGRCCEELGLYQTALRQYESLKAKHTGFLFSKTDYWSRVWHTRAEDRIETVKQRMAAIEYKPYAADSLASVLYDLCVDNKRGPAEFGKRSIKEWITPEEVTEIAQDKLQLSAKQTFGGEITDSALKVWNYVAENYPYLSSSAPQENWQLPQETIQRRGGYGADLSFLLASILISGGADSSKVWVMIGKDKDGHEHFWVNINHKDEWYMIEPSWKPPFTELPLAKYENYTLYYAFNNKKLMVNPRLTGFIPQCN